MAPAFTLTNALDRARGRRDAGQGSMSVHVHRYCGMDYLVQAFSAGTPPQYNRIATFWDDGTFRAYDSIAQGLGYETAPAKESAP